MSDVKNNEPNIPVILFVFFQLPTSSLYFYPV
jgi:hypothetical protein